MPRRGPHNPNISWFPHLQLSWGGVLGTPPIEIWTNGIRWVWDNALYQPTPAELQDLMAAASTPLTLWINAPGTASLISNAAHLNWLKANWILSSGLQRDSNTNRYDAADGPGMQPQQVAWYSTQALTLTTGFKRGRGHSGRIFPPCVVAGADQPAGSPYVPAAQCEGMALEFANCLKAIRTAWQAQPGGAGHFAVLSPGDATKGTGPVAVQITGVMCEATPDVQHRRTRQIPRLATAIKPL